MKRARKSPAAQLAEIDKALADLRAAGPEQFAEGTRRELEKELGELPEERAQVLVDIASTTAYGAAEAGLTAAREMLAAQVQLAEGGQA